MLNNNYTTYEEGLEFILNNGSYRQDRTGTGTISLFGLQMRYNLRNSFPAVTTKKLAWKACLSELLWFIEGSTSERRLAEIQYGKPVSELSDKRTIWTDNWEAWTGKKLNKDQQLCDLGSVYGMQWRHFAVPTDGMNEYFEFDQLTWLINELKTNPNSRKMVVLSYSPEQINKAALTACHTQVQFQVQNGKLNCMWTQASVDLFLGLPFNILSYAILTHMLAKEAGLEVGELIGSLGDVHIYENAVENLKEQIKREPLEQKATLWLNPDKNIFTYDINDVKIENYVSHDKLTAKMAV